jgi:hypothetical protein
MYQLYRIMIAAIVILQLRLLPFFAPIPFEE